VGTDTVPEFLLAIATASECTLVEWLQTKVSLLMLEEISANDYGQESAEHLAGIQAQLAADPPLGMLPWCPREVLELERWNDPDYPSMDKPPSGARGHIKRLLACTILLRNGAYVNGPYGLSEEDFFLQTSAASLVRLTQSALALEIPVLGLGFMLWLFEVQPHAGLRPFTAFCALALAAATGFGSASEREIIQACSWVDAEEARSRDALGHDVDSERWLIGINSYEGLRDRAEDWLLVARQALEEQQKAYSPKTAETLRRFSRKLTGN
jgi:hypothetical protein